MLKLSLLSTSAPPKLNEDEIKGHTKLLIDKLGELQHLLYAEGRRSMLVVLQGMDASGKDGAIRKVFSRCNLSGTRVSSFGKPSDKEREHDFLWRIHPVTPARGEIAIFNRSHYEDILIQRVHRTIDLRRVKQRMEAINSFERLLEFDNDTVVVKFFLHISRAEQERQLNTRLNDPTKFWKHNEGDWAERKHWNEYMQAYEFAINQSTIPWVVCPSDNRWYRDYVIASTLVGALQKLRLRLPKPARRSSRAS